jgi:hypothetical protein
LNLNETIFKTIIHLTMHDSDQTKSCI